MARRRRPLLRALAALLLVAAAALLAAWYFRPDWQPGWVAGKLPVAPSAQVRLYRWRDASGRWVVTDEPPPEGVTYELLRYRNDENVMPAFESD